MIVKVFKHWRLYFESYTYKVFVLTDHNNFQNFRDRKRLSSWQVNWAQELFFYNFCIHYQQNFQNLADLLLKPAKNNDNYNELQIKKIQLIHQFHESLLRGNLFVIWACRALRATLIPLVADYFETYREKLL